MNYFKISLFIILPVLIIGFLGPLLFSAQRFEVGDCVTLTSNLAKELEAWEKKEPPEYIEKILEIGNKNYRTALYYFLNNKYEKVGYSKVEKSVFLRLTKVECPK